MGQKQVYYTWKIPRHNIKPSNFNLNLNLAIIIFFFFLYMGFNKQLNLNNKFLQKISIIARKKCIYSQISFCIFFLGKYGQELNIFHFYDCLVGCFLESLNRTHCLYLIIKYWLTKVSTNLDRCWSATDTWWCLNTSYTATTRSQAASWTTKGSSTTWCRGR